MNTATAPTIDIDQDAARDTLLLHLMRGGTFGHYWTPDGKTFVKDGRTLREKYTQWFSAADPKPPLDSWLEKNLYWGVHPTTCKGLDPDIKANKQRSSVAIVAAVNCFFSEFDGKDYVQPDEYAPHLPASFADLSAHDQREAIEDAQEAAFPLAPEQYKARAWQHIAQMPLAPSVIVDSGGGYHVYHLLAEPVMVDESNRQRIADVQAAWVHLVGSDPSSKDLARVLRVPGTHNRKPYFTPNYPLCSVVTAEFDRLYTLVDFEHLTEGVRVERVARPVSIGSSNGYHGDDYENAADALRRLSPWRCDDRDEWIRVGMSLKAGLGEAGLELWDQWSQGSRKYTPGDCEGRWKTLRPSSMSLGTLIWRAQEDNPKPKQDAVHVYEYAFAPPAELPDPATLDVELTPEERVQAVDSTEPDEEITPKHRTWPYVIRKGRMHYLFYDKDDNVCDKPIADFAASIVEEIVDEHGDSNLVIEGKGLRRGKFRCEIAGTDFGSDAKLLATLTAATGGIDIVYSGMSPHLRPAIGKLTATADCPQRTRYYRTGWQDDSYLSFLMPGMDDTTLISVPRQIAYAAPNPQADLQLGLIALTQLVDAMKPELTAPVVAALFMPPMLRPAGLGNERVAVFIAGRTGSLKTSWAQTAMCLYGPGFASNDNLLKLGEGATRNAIMAFAAHAHDMPLLIDNYKPNTGNGKHDFVNLIHNILEGGDRKRSSRDGELRDTKLVRCIPIVTGEDLPRDDAASIARILLVTFDWQRGEPNDTLTAAQELSEHLCAVGWAWITWLQSEEGRTATRAAGKAFPRLRTEWATRLSRIEKDSANIARVASNLAVNQLAWELVCQHPQIGPALRQYSQYHAAGLKSIARTMAKSTVEALEAHQYRAVLRELLSNGQYKLIDKSLGSPSDHDRDRVLGWFDAAGIYLQPVTTMAAIRRMVGQTQLLISSQTLYGQMEQLGWLASTDKNQTTKTISIDGKKLKVLHLLSKVVDGSGDSNDDDEDDLALAEMGL